MVTMATVLSCVMDRVYILLTGPDNMQQNCCRKGKKTIHIFTSYCTSSTIYLYMHEQMDNPDEHVSKACSCSCIHK